MNKRGNPNLVAGVSGNPAGRPVGSRNRLTNALVADLTASWEKHGPAVLERLRIDDPATYARLAVSLVPKDVQISVEQKTPGSLEPEAWAALRRVLDIIQAANVDGEPQQIFEAIEADLRARFATDVSNSLAIVHSVDDK
jgi:hypothetical protein